jgi:hypothetical protein
VTVAKPTDGRAIGPGRAVSTPGGYIVMIKRASSSAFLNSTAAFRRQRQAAAVIPAWSESVTVAAPGIVFTKRCASH